MFPFIEVAGAKISMTALGIIVALLTFIGTTYYLCRKHHQDFFKLFYRLPIRIIFMYLLGRYITVVLETSSFIPTSFTQVLTILRPRQFDFHFVGILIALTISLGTFFARIKRTENKKIRADILFSGICNAIIILGIFLTLGDTFIGKPTDSIFAIKTLHPESELTKFDGVYPIGLFLSIGALVVSIIINVLKIFLKKN
ncbi:MAG: hypothetical protein LBD75_05680 [Candidatus Peribacteria bacterium]|jgi:hypothetical protein|nr:hypothetical protein [Candidatus Peribacteria bacterium]